MDLIYISEDWPAVVIKIIGSPETDEDVHRVITQWTSIYTESMVRNEKYKLVFDIRDAQVNNFEVLRQLALFLIKVKGLTEKWMDRTAILVSDDNIKRILRFVFVLYKPVRPFKIFSEDVRALTWLASGEPGDSEKL